MTQTNAPYYGPRPAVDPPVWRGTPAPKRAAEPGWNTAEKKRFRTNDDADIRRLSQGYWWRENGTMESTQWGYRYWNYFHRRWFYVDSDYERNEFVWELPGLIGDWVRHYVANPNETNDAVPIHYSHTLDRYGNTI